MAFTLPPSFFLEGGGESVYINPLSLLVCSVVLLLAWIFRTACSRLTIKNLRLKTKQKKNLFIDSVIARTKVDVCTRVADGKKKTDSCGFIRLGLKIKK